MKSWLRKTVCCGRVLLGGGGKNRFYAAPRCN